MDSGIEIMKYRNPHAKAILKNCLFLLFFILPFVNLAQTLSTDTLRKNINALQELGTATKFDSVRNAKLNSIDSMRDQKLSKADSISKKLSNTLDASTKKLNSQIDSLGKLNLSPDKHTKKLDSLYKSFQSNTVDKLKSQYDSLGIKMDQKLSKLESFVEKRSNAIDSLIKSRRGKPISLNDKADLEKFNAKLPELPNTPDLNMPSLGISADLNLPIVNNPSDGIKIPDANVGDGKLKTPETSGLEQLSELKDKAEIGKEYLGDAGKIKEEAKKVKEGEYSEEIKKEAEEQVKDQTQNIDQVKELSKETKSIEALKDKAGAVGDVTTQKEQLRTKARTSFKDHFAGKGEVVNKDMQKIGKLQMKYRNVADSRNLPKRVPNEMKGKPFYERLIPAISFQVFNAQNVSVDFAPSIGYRISGKLRAGMGAYRRITYLEDEREVKIEDLFGLRLYGSLKLIRTFYVHSEFEAFKNAAIPKADNSWSHKFNFGIYNTYKLTKHVNGHIILMYDIMQIKEFPQSKNSSLRFGFDYQFLKAKKK